MKLKVIGAIMLALSLVSIIGATVPVSATPGWIPEDIVVDGVIDIFDLVQVGIYFGQSVPPAPAEVDVTGDSIVDILDVVAVATHFGETGD